MSLNSAVDSLLVAAGLDPSTVDLPTKRVICDAALAYARERELSAFPERKEGVGSGSVGPGAGLVLRFGRSKGLPLSAVETNDLRWYETAYQRSIQDPSKARFADTNRAELALIQSELGRRG